MYNIKMIFRSSVTRWLANIPKEKLGVKVSQSCGELVPVDAPVIWVVLVDAV